MTVYKRAVCTILSNVRHGTLTNGMFIHFDLYKTLRLGAVTKRRPFNKADI